MEEEIEREVALFTRRFAGEESYLAALRELGWSEKELRYRVAARIQQEKYLENMIEVEVGEDEARAWFEQNIDQLGFPERVRARHIFRSTVGLGGEKLEAAERTLRDAMGELEGGAEFADLARRLSEDERTRDNGGELGWLQRGRVPEDLQDTLFSVAPGTSVLVRSRMGWHLLEVLERKVARKRDFAEARGEVLAALEAVKRRDGLREYRKGLREREQNHIEVFLDVLERGL